ncbi:MAG: hypothetical protein E7385_08220 [Ruminococcaceae bacterium]|nr:hypothetical protein [Oscillospiraceae bacterium]
MSEEKSLTKKEIIVTGANSEIKVFDEQLKKYRKKYVNEYIAKLNSHYCEIIEANNRDFAALGERYNELVDTYNELLAEHNKLSTSYIALQGEKASVAQALIDAQNTAKEIIEEARENAAREMTELDAQAEVIRESIVDRNKKLRDMRIEVQELYSNMRKQMENAMKEINEKIEKDMEFFSASGMQLAEKYNDNGENKE